MVSKTEPELRQALREILNRYGRETESHTPTFVLAQYLLDCLEAFDRAVNVRADWYEAGDPEPDDESPWRL